MVLAIAYLLVASVASLILSRSFARRRWAAIPSIPHPLGRPGRMQGMKLYRLIPPLTLALVVLALLSACGGKGGGY
jgi:hypothetical protein